MKNKFIRGDNMNSVLIDAVIKPKLIEQIGNIWYYSKPIMKDIKFHKKVQWCIEILQGKAIAVHFKSDEKN